MCIGPVRLADLLHILHKLAADAVGDVFKVVTMLSDIIRRGLNLLHFRGSGEDPFQIHIASGHFAESVG
jgi:hypothetical protein